MKSKQKHQLVCTNSSSSHTLTGAAFLFCHPGSKTLKTLLKETEESETRKSQPTHASHSAGS